MTAEPAPAQRPGRTPLTARWFLEESLTARGAAFIIASFTLVMTVGGAVLVRVLDHHEFSSIGSSLWWSLQTVSTVGYGDIVPERTSGRLIGAGVMLVGLGFMAVITAAVTAALVENARRRLSRTQDRHTAEELRAIEARLASIEAELRRAGDAARSDHGVP